MSHVDSDCYFVLIEYEFNFKTPTNGSLVIFRREEKIHDILLGEQFFLRLIILSM